MGQFKVTQGLPWLASKLPRARCTGNFPVSLLVCRLSSRCTCAFGSSKPINEDHLLQTFPDTLHDPEENKIAFSCQLGGAVFLLAVLFTPCSALFGHLLSQLRVWRLDMELCWLGVWVSGFKTQWLSWRFVSFSFKKTILFLCLSIFSQPARWGSVDFNKGATHFLPRSFLPPILYPCQMQWSSPGPPNHQPRMLWSVPGPERMPERMPERTPDRQNIRKNWKNAE